MRLTLLLVLALAATAAAQSDPKTAPAELLRFVPPRTAALVGLRPQALLDSALLKPLLSQLPAASTADTLAQLRLIDQVYFALTMPPTMPPNRPPTRPAGARAGGKAPANPLPDMLVLVTGDFRHGIPALFRQPGTTTAHAVNNRLLLFGPRAAIQAALRRAATAAPAASAFASEIGQWSGSDFWLLADVSQMPPLPLSATIANRTAALPFEMKDLRTIALGLSFQNDLVIQANIGAASPAVAQALLHTFHDQVSKQGDAALRDLMKAAVLTAEGSRVRFSATVKQAELEAATRSLQKSFSFPQPAEPGAATRRAAAPAPASAPTPARKASVWGAGGN